MRKHSLDLLHSNKVTIEDSYYKKIEAPQSIVDLIKTK